MDSSASVSLASKGKAPFFALMNVSGPLHRAVLLSAPGLRLQLLKPQLCFAG